MDDLAGFKGRTFKHQVPANPTAKFPICVNLPGMIFAVYSGYPDALI